MPSITCPGCGASLLVEKRYVNCPWCGVPLASAYAERAEQTITDRRAWLSKPELLAVSTVAAAGLLLIVLGSGWSAPPLAKDREQFRILTGLSICQQRLVRHSRSGRMDVPPRVSNQGGAAEFFYEWPEGAFYFERADGLPVPMRATCRGRIATGRLTELTLNGDDILASAASLKSPDAGLP